MLHPPIVMPYILHGQEKLYTLALVDPGRLSCILLTHHQFITGAQMSPTLTLVGTTPIAISSCRSSTLLSEAVKNLRPCCFRTNIPLSASRASQVTESQGQTILSYIPPHPNRGTGNHRYVTVLLEQATSDPLPSFQAERTGFNLRDLIATHSLTPVGIHFYRAQWSPVVSTIYSDVLSAFHCLAVCLCCKIDLFDRCTEQQEPRFLKTAPPTDLHKLLRQNQTASQTKWAPFKERLSQI